MSGTRCLKIQEDLVGILDGTASEPLLDHVAQCDDCRDARHDLESASRDIARAGDDFALGGTLADRLAEIAAEAAESPQRKESEPAAERVSETRMRAGKPEASNALERPGRKAIWLLVAALATAGASVAIGASVADKRAKSPEIAATRAWHGKVSKIARSGADTRGGLSGTAPNGSVALSEGAEVKPGMVLVTDGRTRARIELDDGSFVVLDRATEVTVDTAARTLVLKDGAILTDVAHVDAAPPARIKTEWGDVKVLGTKLAVTATQDRTNVEVLRGEVEVTATSASKSERVSAGQEGVVSKDGRIDVAPANDLAQRAAFGEQLVVTNNDDAEPAASGLGELRARRPGRTDEKDHAVRLAKHAVKVRIAGNVARTEVDEEFTNDTNDELEGIYRFPLPPGAQIERLGLEVDGKMVDGEFIDKAKASAIWRGALQNAAPQAPKPREEIVWVPGPWHDPALLEWARGGRFELRIFPIPKKGSRRVVIAYTETVAPVSGVRRYVYPLPQGASSKLTIDQFSVDAQVLGHDGQSPVRVRGYDLEKKTEGSAARLTASLTKFTPSGDLAIEYALDDKKTDATAWAYTDTTPEVSPTKTAGGRAEKVEDPVGADPFVAIALRPKLPKWQDARVRDQVIVVDSGRAMFGERFARAKRLAVQLAQEMDRRDRVTVLACDVKCKAMSAGFVAPGAPAAHDVDAFLTSVTPDGASDLVSAVRAAAQTQGREATRDLRVVLVSDGVATAGYRSGARVASEVSDALDGRGEVVTVPIGADADTILLGEIARGGGGVVVPYQPGQRLESSALEVLNATYGTTLRDVEVVLPDGLRDAAPARIAPIRAGSETIVAARMRGEAVRGDVILRGRVGGEPFEARYPVDVRTTTDRGNAFVPRLFAAARIAEREREATTDASKAELVALSRRFAVPSKFTSLLVLESEAMFKAFGIERTGHAAQWTGESAAQGFVVASAGRDKDKGYPSTADSFDDEAGKKADMGDALGESSFGQLAAGAGGGASGARKRAMSDEPAPAATMAAPAPAEAPQPEAKASRAPARSAPLDFEGPRDRRPRRGGRFMKKIYVRHASIATDAAPTVAADKVAAARAAVLAAPDERSKHKELAKVLALSGQLDELGEALERWSTRDPLDADVIMARADVAARRGDRDGSIRILSGALAASALGPQEAFVLATTVGRGYERLGKPEACSFFVTAAELRSTDNDALARAVACERGQGRAKSADRWLAGLKDAQRKGVDAALAKVDPSRPESLHGDIVVSATWDGTADLDVALVDPAGRRASAVSRLKGARVEGATSRDHETLALSTGDAGPFVVEMVRANAEAAAPVSGKVTIRAFGHTQTVPFTLTRARTQVARIDVRWDTELVPVDGDEVIGGGLAPFDRGAAATALARVSVSHCAIAGQVGTGHVTVTFAPSGRVSEVVVDDGRFAGTPAGRCAQAAFWSATVAPFSDGPARVGKSFTIGAP